MKKILFIIIPFIILSCKSTLKSTYQSSCFLFGQPEYILKINSSDSFYFKSFLGDSIVGKWNISKDTLILNSDYFIKKSSFDIEKDSILENTKYTEFDKQEKYLIKKRKLFLITKDSISKVCYLKQLN